MVRLVVAWAIAAVLSGTVIANPQTQPTEQAIPAQGSNAFLDDIRNAAAPSDAISAYAAAVGSTDDRIAIEQAYVQRMVEFDLPEMAEAQALGLTRRAPTDGLAWAVTAHMSARRGNHAGALTHIAVAVRHLPQDPFVQRTAAQLLAWYDVRADQSQLDDSVKQSVEAVRSSLNEQPAFAEEYANVKQRFEHPDLQPSTSETYSDSGTYTPIGPPVSYGTYDYSPYTESPIYPSPYYYGAYRGTSDPFWPRTYYGYRGYYGSSRSFHFNTHRFQHRDFDRDDRRKDRDRDDDRRRIRERENPRESSRDHHDYRENRRDRDDVRPQSDRSRIVHPSVVQRHSEEPRVRSTPQRTRETSRSESQRPTRSESPRSSSSRSDDRNAGRSR